jgi:hypothetical protein
MVSTLTLAVFVAQVSVSEAATRDPGSVLIGVYTGAVSGHIGDQHAGDWLPRAHAMQAWQGKRNAVLGMYTRIEDPVDDVRETLEEAWNDLGAVPMISWWTAPGGRASNALLAYATYDNQINPFVTMLRMFLSGPDRIYGNGDDRRVFFRPAYEANGDWEPWSPDFNHPPDAQYRSNINDFKAMWAHLHDRFEAQGLGSDHVQWIYTVNFDDAYRAQPVTGEREQIAEDLYPGDANVDWLGVDAHNFSTALAPDFPWMTPAEVMEPMLSRLHAFRPSKPLAVELSTTSAGASREAKADWITQYSSYLRDPQASGRFVNMSVWFNQNNPSAWRGGPPADWAVFSPVTDPYDGPADEQVTGQHGSFRALSAYRKMLTSNAWITGSNPSDPRLLTDAQFRGN